MSQFPVVQCGRGYRRELTMDLLRAARSKTMTFTQEMPDFPAVRHRSVSVYHAPRGKVVDTLTWYERLSGVELLRWHAKRLGRRKK